MHPKHQNFFYRVKLYHKKILRKFWVPRPTPHPPTSNQKLAIFGLVTKLRPPEIRVGCVGAPNFFCQKTTSYRCIICCNITLITQHFRNDHFPFRFGKGKIPISGAFAPETRRKNGDIQMLVVWSSYYGGFYLGTGCFCDKKILALRRTPPLISGGRSLVSRPKIANF